ncbi:hypothetical protein GJ744_000712 [Endocarpon pusillum]|uniref:Uncharacterized protein n=1 Tax=Endocarpon pusillum TaxID=364733 RepID=A0A8H7E1N0_9EURO|nr:hypothetical protein GJ744_000712 [Endocarpon pusillum]
MEVDHETRPFILLNWSPLHEIAAKINIHEYPRLAKQWFLREFGSMMLRLDTILRDLWKSEWPVRCAYFLTQGSCKRVKDRSCLYMHEKVKPSDSAKKVSLLIKISSTFCRLTAMHRKRLIDDEFHEKFFRVRRYWLESLLQELIFVSSFEQRSQTMVEAQSKIISANRNPGQGKGLCVLAASIEDLLFHRLGKDFSERNDISSLFEQTQVSQVLDYNVQRRFAGYLMDKLSRSADTQAQLRQLWALRSLEGSIGYPDPSAFRQSLRQFTSQILLVDVRHFLSFHSVTTVFEFFAAYLIIRSCRVAVLLPQSWIDIHLPWFAYIKQSLLAREVSNDDLRIYTASLLELTTCYCQLVSRLDSLPGPVFRLGLHDYQSRLLWQRNMELLALIVVNWGFGSNGMEGFQDVWRRVRQVFFLPFTRGFHLQHTTISELLEQLIKSYRAYEGKDVIKLARKTNGRYAADSQLRKLSVQSVPLAELLIPTASTSYGPSQAVSSNETEAQRSHQIRAAEKIQQFWRSHYPALLAKRAFLETSMGRTYMHVLEICKRNNASTIMRHLLLGNAVELLENIHSMSSTASELQQRAVNLVKSLPQDKFELVDEVRLRVIAIEESLGIVAQTVSTERLEELIKAEGGGRGGGYGEEAQRVFRNVENVLNRVGGDTSKVRRMMEAIEGAG